ncbi:MAG: diadenylate cyclase CdaA [Clostridiales bacterium]|nr:diadenylate cyclase CdaA [Clostridiales bacterium]
MALYFERVVTLIKNAIDLLRWQDIVDMLIIAILLYKILMFIRESSAAQVIKGIVGIIIATQILSLLQLKVSHFLFSSALQIGIIALIILFQPELRRMLDSVGRRRFSKIFKKIDEQENALALRSIALLTEAAEKLSETRTGALICIERQNRLGDIMKTGTLVNADISVELLTNIFYDKAPLHDGALIVKDWRIAAAGCRLPLSENKSISRDLGMRHRAGLGLSEVTDSFVLIVSEETGGITVAEGGILKRNLTPAMLNSLLKLEFVSESPEKQSISRFFSFKKSKKDDGDN